MRGASFVVLSLFLLFGGVFVPACAPSIAEVTQARQAEYDPREYAAIFAACQQTMEEFGYHLAAMDSQHGILVSQWRLYSKDGTAIPYLLNGAAMFRVGVELGKGPHGGLIVHVNGGAQGYTSGSPVARAFKHDDPEEPTWVEGKIDNLAVGIYEKLSKFQLVAGTPGVTPAATPATPAAPAPEASVTTAP
jgi:hypothetical protein